MKRKQASGKKSLIKPVSVLVGIGVMVSGLTWADARRPHAATTDLAISLTARKVVLQANGREQLQPAERAFPGEVIQYDARYENRSTDRLNNVSPTLPIPKGMVFVPDSAQPVPAEASLDGRKFAPIPLKRKVVTATGQVREETVAPTEYRALRWRLGVMAAGAQAVVSARTQLVSSNR